MTKHRIAPGALWSISEKELLNELKISQYRLARGFGCACYADQSRGTWQTSGNCRACFAFRTLFLTRVPAIG